ncbi:lectin-like domain-containing protein, partial [Staphylococcus schweitzeri]|uniref:lectin-like domain-containing protein n=1 Tax=Staphylococcus schweitzeri TaxID=1654388 RepID=UPI000647225B
MSKRQKEFHDSLVNEKTRVKLYKSGKNWVKSGIKELEMFKIIGLPFISQDIDNHDNDSVSKKMTSYSLKTTAVIGGAFTVNMLHDQQAFAASDAPLTSELNTQSETVGNQNSTTIKGATSTTDSTNAMKNSSSIQTSNSDTTSSEKSESVASTVNSTSNQQETTASTSELTSSKNNTSISDTKSTSLTSSTEQQSNTLLNQSTTPNNTSQSTTLSSANLNKTSTTSTSIAPVKLRTFSRLAMSSFASAATTSALTANTITVNKDNFKQHMTTSGNATYDQSTGIVTLTQDITSQRGAITLGTRIDSNKSFHFSGKVNLGNKYEGHGNGGDGIGFAFSPGVLGETGLNGAAVGIGGLSNAFGFKLDTYHNTSKPNSAAKANADPSNVAGGGAFGAFVTTDSYGVATTYTSSSTADNAAKLNVQPTNNTFQDFDINYNGDTKVMTVKYAGQTWTRNISDWIAKSGTTNFSLSMTASTGGATNLQQVQFGTFEYTESAVTQVRYVDVTTGKDIISPKTYSGNVDQVVTIDNQQSAMSAKGYNYTSVDSSYASTYNDTNKTVKMTNAGQSVTYYFTDVKAPTVTVGNQTTEVGKSMNPIVLTTTDNGTGTVTNTVTGLPSGLSYDSATNSIIGTPTKIGQSTVTVVSIDQANNKSTTTFTINVVDTTAPTVTPIGDQSSEVFSTISPIKIATQDNSGNAVTNTVTGLPSGLTFDSTTNTISGTPATIGTNTVTIVSADTSGNKTTTTFKYEVTRNSMSDSVSTSSSTVQSQSVSSSTVNSQSASTSTSESIATSTSASTSKSTSISLSDSASVSKSLSTSESNSVSSSTSTSLANSQSVSSSMSDSASKSTLLSDSISNSSSTEKSESLSTSTSDSLRTSTSLSDSLSMSTSGSLSKSQSLSTSTSGSSSTSQSLSDSTSNAISTSTSLSDSLSMSTSGSLSKSQSLSTSTSGS